MSLDEFLEPFARLKFFFWVDCRRWLLAFVSVVIVAVGGGVVGVGVVVVVTVVD